MDLGRTISLVLLLGLLGVFGWRAFFVVAPEEQAVITRFGVIDRVLGPGLQFHTPFAEVVHRYPVLLQRQTVLPRDFLVARCPATVTLTYRVGDVEAYHLAGADDGAILGVGAQVETALAGASSEEEATARLRADLAGSGPGGLLIVQADVETGDCGPQPPRIVFQDIPLGPIPTVGTLLPERSSPFETRLRLADNTEITLRDLVVTWAVTDEGRRADCFGRFDDAIGIRLQSLAEHVLRGRSATVSNPELLSDGLTAEIARLGGDIGAQCGIEIGGVDFGAASVTQRTAVDCASQPNAEGCLDLTLRPSRN